MRCLHAIAVLLLGAFVCISSGQEKTKRKPAGELPAIKELPNPFLFADGSPVRTAKEWEQRRVEIKGLFEDYMYGHMPPKPQKMTVKKGEKVTDETNKVILQNLEVQLEHEGKKLTINVKVALPMNSKGKVPVLIQSSFGFGKGGPASGKRFTTFTNQGYAVAEFSFNQIAADSNAKARAGGVYQLFGADIDCGALMAWAWGVSRVIDALETVPEIDITKVIITGHSRYGKAALIAGAFDERIAVTVPSHSGCAGVAPYRFIFGKSEQLHNIAGVYPYWFRPDFNQFKDNVERLPVDQHLLLALVAPRALMDTEGTMDAWTNPEGAQLSHLAAKKVYTFLKADDKISIRYRPVGHIPSNVDVIAFADFVFFSKKLPAEFGKLAYPEETKGFTWDVPR